MLTPLWTAIAHRIAANSPPSLAVSTGLIPPPHWRPPPRAPLALSLRQTAAYACLLTRVALEVHKGQADASIAWRQRFMRWALEQLSIDLRVEGEPFPSDGGYLVMWNQESHLDHLAIPAVLPRPVLTLFNNAVKATPFYGAYLQRTGHFHVDRHDETQWRASIARAAQALGQGACILVSPEGTRTWDGHLLDMKRGAFILARAAQRPIIALTLIGGHERLPRTAYTLRPGPLIAHISHPIPVQGDAVGLEARISEHFRSTKARYLDQITSSLTTM